MAQTISLFGFKGTGIVGLFLVGGIILTIITPESGSGQLFLNTSYGVGLLLAILGIYAVAKRVM